MTEQTPPEEAPPEPPRTSNEADAADAAPEGSREARAAQRELLAHAPSFVFEGGRPQFDGSLVGGDQHGVSGGQVQGDVYLGGHTQIFHGPPTAAPRFAGTIPPEYVVELADTFAEEGSAFDDALTRLRDERILVLCGAEGSGRWAAALVLLHRIGCHLIHALSPETTAAQLPEQLTRPVAHVLRDLKLNRDHRFTDADLFAARSALPDGGFLVITVDSAAHLVGVNPCHWRPPAAHAVLAAWTRHDTSLLALEPVAEFLAEQHHRVGEAAEFGRRLRAYGDDRTEAALDELRRFGSGAVLDQCRAWLSDPAADLREQAFLVSLAVFDGAPYVLAAELADRLFLRFQQIQHPELPPGIPVFGPTSADRLERVRASGAGEGQETPWGSVPQFVVRFQQAGMDRAVLTEVWREHPSARGALVEWLRELAADSRPTVRTRAASAAAVLTTADLPSAIALLVDGWARSRSYARRVTAANSLTLAELLGAPAVVEVLRQWCTDGDWTRRWTAIRGFALLAPLRPELADTALDVLTGRARADSSSDTERRNLIESTALLLSGARQEDMLTEFVGLLHADTDAVRDLALAAFVTACDNAEPGALVTWYATTGMYAERTARAMAALWRGALRERAHTREALAALRTWLGLAAEDIGVETALVHLLPALITTADDRDRLVHALDTYRSPDGTRPAVTDTLLASLRAISLSPAHQDQR